MPWVRHANPYFSCPMPWWARWPLSRVLRYVATFTVGVITGAALTGAGVGRPDGALAISEVAPGIPRVQRAGIVRPVEQVAVLAETDASRGLQAARTSAQAKACGSSGTAVVLANRGARVSTVSEEDPDR